MNGKKAAFVSRVLERFRQNADLAENWPTSIEVHFILSGMIYPVEQCTEKRRLGDIERISTRRARLAILLTVGRTTGDRSEL